MSQKVSRCLSANHMLLENSTCAADFTTLMRTNIKILLLLVEKSAESEGAVGPVNLECDCTDVPPPGDITCAQQVGLNTAHLMLILSC